MRPTLARLGDIADGPVDAVSRMADHLRECRHEHAEPDPDPGLVESFALHLELLLARGEDGGLGPPVRSWPVAAEPLAFGRMAFSTDAARLLYEGPDGMVCLDAETGRVTPSQPEDPRCYATDRWQSPDGRLTTDRRDFVGLVDRASGQVLRRLSWKRTSSEACTANVAFSPDGAIVAVSYAWDSTVRLFETETAALLGELHAPDHEAHLAFSPDQRFLLAGTKSGVRLFLLSTGLTVLPQPRRRAYTVAYHPEGTSIVVSDEGPSLHRIELGALSRVGTPTFEAVYQRVLENEALLTTHPGTIWPTLIHLIRCTC